MGGSRSYDDVSWPFGDLPRGQYGALLVDAPLRFKTYNNATSIIARGSKRLHYHTMSTEAIMGLPVLELAAPDCALLLWTSPPFLEISLEIIRR